LFTRTLSRFKFIIKFKPLLDAYQGPYKIKFYYWTGVQLVIRVVFYGISSLDRNINLIIGIMLLSIISVFHGFVQPFKVKYKNYQELVYMVNLQWTFLVLLYNQDNKKLVNILISFAGIHFICIVIYHFSTYMFSGVIRKKTELGVSTLLKLINKLLKRNFQQLDKRIFHMDNIPEVTYKYCEYQEPLVGLD